MRYLVGSKIVTRTFHTATTPEKKDKAMRTRRTASMRPRITLKSLVTADEEDLMFNFVPTKNGMTTEEVLAEMDCRGLRPATEKELIEFVSGKPSFLARVWSTVRRFLGIGK